MNFNYIGNIGIKKFDGGDRGGLIKTGDMVTNNLGNFINIEFYFIK